MRVMRVMRNIAAKEDLHKVIEQFGGADDRYEIVNNRMIPETKSFLRDFSADALLSELKRRNTELIVNAVKVMLRNYSAQYITVYVNKEMAGFHYYISS